MGDQLLVVAVRHLGALAHELREPVRIARNVDLDPVELAFAEGVELVIGLGDAPLHRAMNVVLSLGLAGVEGMQRIGVVVA